MAISLAVYPIFGHTHLEIWVSVNFLENLLMNDDECHIENHIRFLNRFRLGLKQSRPLGFLTFLRQPTTPMSGGPLSPSASPGRRHYPNARAEQNSNPIAAPEKRTGAERTGDERTGEDGSRWEDHGRRGRIALNISECSK